MIDDEHYQEGFQRRKREALDDAARRRRNLLIVMPLVIGAVLLLRQLGLLTRDIPPVAPELVETLTLTSSTQTQYSYEGALELVFSGVIVSAAGERDAFYSATQAGWEPAPPIFEGALEAPLYSTDHVYRVPYEAGTGVRPLRFTLPDDVISSTLRVEIYRQP